MCLHGAQNGEMCGNWLACGIFIVESLISEVKISHLWIIILHGHTGHQNRPNSWIFWLVLSRIKFEFWNAISCKRTNALPIWQYIQGYSTITVYKNGKPHKVLLLFAHWCLDFFDEFWFILRVYLWRFNCWEYWMARNTISLSIFVWFCRIDEEKIPKYVDLCGAHWIISFL